MIIDELDTSSNYRLNRLMRVLENMYGVTIDFGSADSRAELQSIYEEYGLVRSEIVREAHYNSYNQNPDYAKACLIQEAIRIFLSEIAPKRTPRPAKNSA